MDEYHRVECPTCGEGWWFPNDGRPVTIRHVTKGGMLKQDVHDVQRPFQTGAP